MLTFAFLLSFLLGLVLGQTPCGPPTTTTSTFHPVVMRYTPSMPIQSGPTSTIYDSIMTSYFNALDCRFVTPLRVDENPTPEGPFTTFVRSPVLVVTRIGCITETAAVTRREFRGQDHLEIRSVGVEYGHKIHKRRTAQEAVDEAIRNAINSYPPDATQLTVQAYRYMVSVNTALFALHVIQAGIDLNQTCVHLREPSTQARLFQTTIDPVQAGDIVCFAANNGIYFAAGTDAVVTYLEDLVYAIQVRSKFPDDTQDFCWPVLTQDSPFLGIDTNGIAKYLCPTFTVPSQSITSTAVKGTNGASSQGTGTNVATFTTKGPIGSITIISGTVTPTPSSNITTSAATITSAPYANTTITSDTTVTTPPYVNTTTTRDATNTTTTDTISSVGTVGTIGTIGTFSTLGNASTGIYPNTTSNSPATNTETVAGTGVGTAVGTGFGTGWGSESLPPSPTGISPSIESVSSTPTRRMRRW